MKRLLFFRLASWRQWWLVGLAFMSLSTATIGCFRSSVPPATRALTPASIISGYIVTGGGTTPAGLFDAPRKFVYKIKIDGSSFVNVAYTAYPPSPYGDQERKKIRLNFHAGTILTGDYLIARGTYDKNKNTLIVAEEGDYIETYPEKPR